MNWRLACDIQPQMVFLLNRTELKSTFEQTREMNLQMGKQDHWEGTKEQLVIWLQYMEICITMSLENL